MHLNTLKYLSGDSLIYFGWYKDKFHYRIKHFVNVFLPKSWIHLEPVV